MPAALAVALCHFCVPLAAGPSLDEAFANPPEQAKPRVMWMWMGRNVTRDGITCDLEGLRGFIPRSQLQEGENHEALVGKTIGAAFLTQTVTVNDTTVKFEIWCAQRAAAACTCAACAHT